MGKQANPKIIGGFVLGSVFLVMMGVLIFGGGQFFTEQETYVVYFEGSINGLNVGAGVRFQGVLVGSVSDITVEFHVEELQFRKPVLISIEPTKFRTVGDFPGLDAQRAINELIKRGLRARLAVQSPLTGLLYVDLDLHPETIPQLVGEESPYPEIPAIPSRLEELSKQLAILIELDWEGLVSEIRNTFQALTGIVNTLEHQTVPTFNATLSDVQTLARNADDQLTPLTAELDNTLITVRGALEKVQDSLTATLENVQQLVRHVDRQVEPLGAHFKTTLTTAGAALGEMQRVLSTVDGVVAERSPLRHDLSQTLEQLAAAARAIRSLADYLDRHPEALLRGKGGPRRR